MHRQGTNTTKDRLVSEATRPVSVRAGIKKPDARQCTFRYLVETEEHNQNGTSVSTAVKGLRALCTD